jgi:hypothetical protein
MIPYYWIGKPKDHFEITLVAKAQPGNKLERRNITIENYGNERSVRWRRTFESTSQRIRQSPIGISWYGKQTSKENLATKLASEANKKKPDLTPEQVMGISRLFGHLRWGQSKSISWHMTLGSQNRDEIWIWTKIVQNL